MQVVSDKLVHAVKSYYIDEIEHTNNKIKEYLSKQDVVLNAETAFMDSFHTLLKHHVWRLSHKTFIYEFHKYRENLSFPADPSSSVIFDQYVKLIDRELINDWFLKYDYLRVLVKTCVENTCSYIQDVCESFSNDASLLLLKGFINQESHLNAVTPLDSDPHNGSKVVLCLEFDSSKKIIYKPRSLEVDVLVDRVFSEILRFDTLKDYSPVAKTVNRGNYGWQEFVQHSPVNQSEVGDAYYNLGLCAAVFSCLGASDLHDENVIFNGIFPYFIDLETSLQPTYDYTLSSLPDLMRDTLSRSIAHTSIIPAKLMTVPHNIMIGAINTPYPQEANEMIFSLKNPGSDAVDIAKEKITINRTAVPIMLTDNQAPDPLPFQKDFLKGYSDAYEKIMDNKEQISLIFTDIHCAIRVVIRPTVQYYFILDACLFPENLVNDETITQVLKYLKPSKMIKDPEISKHTLEEEIRSLKNGDIPYFSTKTNSKRLYSSAFITKEIFGISADNNVKIMLKNLSQKRLLLDKRFIAEGYSDIRIHAAKYKKVRDLGHQSPLFSNVLQEVTKDNINPLIELLMQLSITTENDSAETGWIGGVYGKLPISYESSNLISFHDTGGILFLLKHLTEHKDTRNHSQYYDLYNQAKRGLKSLSNAYYSQQNSASASIISGSSSLNFVLKHNGSRLKEVEEVVSRFQSEEVPCGDIFNGLAGIGLMLASFSDTADGLLKIIYHKISNDKQLSNLSSDGIAHGNLGIIWAKFRISYALGNLEECRDLFKQTLQISFPNTVNASGWCNGNAGLLMVLAEMARTLKEQLDLYELAKKSIILPENGPVDLSICHGVAGVLQSLLFAHEAFGDSWYLSLANQYWLNALDLANAHGFYTGENNRDYLLGYFLGWSGVADSALLLEMSNNGEHVWFPINLSSVAYQQNNVYKEYKECVH
ncbi:type 2 lanthipeptide synthetase LanM [Priestia megaterium]|uniref:type 2 lanthipeptide synthetase LanM n=1 Tax=Priestia megaterium TaxID=1404 RepID=UPI001642F43B|nr:type 2 lanthipeptide synthetase LanM [Priestia megaterium]